MDDVSGDDYTVRIVSATHDLKHDITTYLLSANQRLANQLLKQPIIHYNRNS